MESKWKIKRSAQAVHDHYAPKGERFDVATLRGYVTNGIRVDLEVGQSERKKAEALELVAA